MKRRWMIAFTFVVCVLAVALQTNAQIEKQTKAFLVDSYGVTPNGDLKGRADLYISEIKRYPGSQGLIVLYGPRSKIEARKRLVREHFSFRRFPMDHVTTKVGGNVSEFRTDFWIIPAGAASPEIKPEAWIEVEFARVYRTQAKKKLDNFLLSLIKYSNHTAVVINYGPPDQVAIRERWLRDQYHNRRYDPSRITLVNGGNGPVRTVMWLVPPGAENPAP